MWRWLSSVTPLGYAFEALLINEFSDTNGERPYRIEGSVSLALVLGTAGGVVRSPRARVLLSSLGCVCFEFCQWNIFDCRGRSFVSFRSWGGETESCVEAVPP